MGIMLSIISGVCVGVFVVLTVYLLQLLTGDLIRIMLLLTYHVNLGILACWVDYYYQWAGLFTLPALIVLTVLAFILCSISILFYTYVEG